MYTVTASAVNHPDGVDPYRSVFNHRILSSLARTEVSLNVVSPLPFAPPVGPYSEYADQPSVEEWGPYTVHRPRFFYLLPKRLFYGVTGDSFAKRVPRYVERTFPTPDVVHACHIYLDGYGMLPYCREHDVPLFVVAHGTLLNTFDEAPQGVQSRVRETLAGCTKVLCVSDALREKAARFVPESKAVTVPIGADPDNFPVDREAAIRRELGISSDSTVVLFVGDLNEAKGIKEIAQALQTLDSPNVEFVFVGDGDLRGELQHALTSSQYSTRHILGKIPPLAVRRWFAVADLLMLPSRTEGRPTVIYEAMASRTAVLASAVGGIPEQVTDGETGVLISPSDAHALAAALDDLVCDRKRLQEMGRQGHERLLQKGWTWENHAERVRELHKAAIKQS